MLTEGYGKTEMRMRERRAGRRCSDDRHGRVLKRGKDSRQNKKDSRCGCRDSDRRTMMSCSAYSGPPDQDLKLEQDALSANGSSHMDALVVD